MSGELNRTVLKLAQEDFEIQLEAATRSMIRGHYATARAELRGAMLILDTMQARADGQ